MPSEEREPSMKNLTACFQAGGTFLDARVPPEKLTLNEIGNWMVENCGMFSHADNCAYEAHCRVSSDFMICADFKHYTLLKAHVASLPMGETIDQETSAALSDLLQKLQSAAVRLEENTKRLRSRGERWKVAAGLRSTEQHAVVNWKGTEMP